jgi:magnesium chelatase family protein
MITLPSIVFVKAHRVRLQSFIQDSHGLTSVEVELTLWPGLPSIQFLGLADQQIKESAHRIKSAIRSQGFVFPKAKQILVNLRPNHLRKSSRGLELAVAIAYLIESGQIQAPQNLEKMFVYGQLDLSGQVYSPEDIRLADSEKTLLTGIFQHKIFSPGPLVSIKTLNDLKGPLETVRLNQSTDFSQTRPSLERTLKLSPESAELMMITALGRHSLLLAGAAGAGKSTFARALYSVLPDPGPPEWQTMLKQRPELNWRPLVRPHHTTPVMTMIGGGGQIFSGEIARAHGGLLILDELLEFHQHVLEALREPMEEKKIQVARGGVVKDFLADCQVVGTTNLCPCAKWTPDSNARNYCQYSNRRCRSTLERLSGPFLDRFEMLAFFSQKRNGSVFLHEVYEKIKAGMAFRAERQAGNPTEDLEKCEQLLPSSAKSHRRNLATLSVARSIADLSLREKIEPTHLQKALQYTYINFEKLLR